MHLVEALQLLVSQRRLNKLFREVEESTEVEEVRLQVLAEDQQALGDVKEHVLFGWAWRGLWVR